MTRVEPSQKESAPPGGKPSCAAPTNLPPGQTEWHTRGPELEGEDGQGGVMREGAAEYRDCDFRRRKGARETEEHLGDDVQSHVWSMGSVQARQYL